MKINKYRGKRTLDGEWVYGSLIQNKTDNGTIISFIVPDLPCAQEPNNLWTARMYQVDTDTVGMFTGVNDIMGTPIYEGDLVLSSENLGSMVHYGLCEVFYSFEDDSPTGYVGFWLAVGYSAMYRYEHLSAHNEQFNRVVGNIYDDNHLYYSDFTDAHGEQMFYLGEWWKEENDGDDAELQEYLKQLKLEHQKRCNDNK